MSAAALIYAVLLAEVAIKNSTSTPKPIGEMLIIREPVTPRQIDTRMRFLCGPGEFEIRYNNVFGRRAELLDMRVNDDVLPPHEVEKLRIARNGREIESVSVVRCSRSVPYTVSILIRVADAGMGSRLIAANVDSTSVTITSKPK